MVNASVARQRSGVTVIIIAGVHGQKPRQSAAVAKIRLMVSASCEREASNIRAMNAL